MLILRCPCDLPPIMAANSLITLLVCYWQVRDRTVISGHLDFMDSASVYIPTYSSISCFLVRLFPIQNMRDGFKALR